MTTGDDKLRAMTQANRRAWNAAAGVLKKQRFARLREQFTQPGFSVLDEHLAGKLGELSLAGKQAVHLCCNNGEELLSTINLGAASGVGFDIADELITEARELAAVAGIDCRFVQSDVYDIAPEFDGRFDLALFTIGALCWIPDLPRAMAVAARLLKPGGDLVVYEMHPFSMMLAVPDEPAYKHPHQIAYSYFQTEPLVDDKGIDYLGHTQYTGPTKYDFPQTLSDVFTAVLAARMTIRSFAEFPHDISHLFGHLEKDALVPLCYLLHARKDATG